MNEHIDLDALFDALNIGSESAEMVAASKQSINFYERFTEGTGLQLDTLDSLEDILSGESVPSDPS
ncbi:MAG: hypothetical protein ABW185_20510 [Sedimenticola sp.]